MYTQCIYIHSGRALTHKTKQNLRDRDRVRNKRGWGEREGVGDSSRQRVNGLEFTVFSFFYGSVLPW